MTRLPPGVVSLLVFVKLEAAKQQIVFCRFDTNLQTCTARDIMIQSKYFFFLFGLFLPPMKIIEFVSNLLMAVQPI